MVSATLLGIGIHLFPYSPRWLALVNRRRDCMISLTKLRNIPSTDERVQAEYHGIITEIVFQRLVEERQHPGVKGWRLELYSWVDLLRKKNWRRTSVGVGVTFFQQFSGTNAFIYYTPTMYCIFGLREYISIRGFPWPLRASLWSGSTSTRKGLDFVCRVWPRHLCALVVLIIWGICSSWLRILLATERRFILGVCI